MAPLEIALAGHSVVAGDGEGRVMVELGRALAARGHRVTVFSHRIDEVLAGMTQVRRVPEVRAVRLLDDLFVNAVGTRAVRRTSFDIAVTMGHWVQPPPGSVYYAEFAHAGWRRAWTQAGRPSSYHRLHARMSEALEGRALRRAGTVIACSDFVARDLPVGANTDVHVVPNGVDLAQFAPVNAREQADARSALGLPGDAFVVGFVGEFRTPRKGLGPLVEAVARGGEYLLVAGDGDKNSVPHLGGRVRVLGFTDPRQVYAAADVVAVPSSYEPFSLVAAEAAASARPVIATHAVGAASYLGAGVRLVDRPAAELLRVALDDVRTADLGRMGAAARTAAERLDWSRTAAQAADVVQAAAMRKRGRQSRAENGQRREDS